MSDSLLTIGITAVDARRYAVATHEYLSKPCRSATILGRALPTIVRANAARNSVSIRPAIGKAIRRAVAGVSTGASRTSRDVADCLLSSLVFVFNLENLGEYADG